MSDFVTMILRGFSQIFFQNDLLLGALIVIGLGLASPPALLLAVIGGATSSFVDKLFGYDPALCHAGVAAFNGILVGTAMSFYIKSFPSAVLATIVGSVVAGIIFFLLVKNNITPYALPFVCVTFVVVALTKIYGIR